MTKLSNVSSSAIVETDEGKNCGVSAATTKPCCAARMIGLAGLFIALLIFPKLAEVIRVAANGLLAHLSLLFVPAGVGVIAHLGTFGANGIGLIVALILSTALAILAAVLTFVLFARLMGQPHE